VRSAGSVREAVTASLPLTYLVPQEYERYTLPGPKVQSDDPEIRRVAEEATANSSDTWERAARLAIYVNGLVRYDDSLVGREMDAKWVLQNRRGVCTEYTTLFIALARSLGIPARFVSGYAFGPAGTWLGHSWAEVYIGEWVPVDPTWLEAGHLDATHIATFRSADNRAENNAVALMTPGAELHWQESDIFGGATEAVRVSNLQTGSPEGNYSLYVGEAELGFGDETVISLKLPGAEYRVAGLDLAPCAGLYEPVSVGESGRKAILRPGEEQYVVWRIRANPSLAQGYIYTCPLLVNSDYLQEREQEITVDPTIGVRADFSAWAGRGTVLAGEPQVIYYNIARLRGGAITLSGSDVQQSAAARAGAGNFTYYPAHLGANRVYVHSGGTVREVDFAVVEHATVRIANFSVPQVAVEGANLTVVVFASSNGTAPRAVRISVSVGAQSSVQQASLAGVQAFNFSIPAGEPGARNVSVVLEGTGMRDEARRMIEIIRRPNVTLANVTFAFVGSGTTVVMQLDAVGEPRAMNVTMGNRTVPAQPGEVSMASQPGQQVVTVEWLDAAGNSYSRIWSVAVPERPQPTPTPTPGGGRQGCAGFAVLLILFGAPLLANRYI